MSEHPKRLLLIFLKEPIAGKVKTRLAQTVGAEEAARIYQSLVSVLIQQLQWMPDTEYRFCFAPADAGEAMQFWLLPQLSHRLEEGQVVPVGEGVPAVSFAPQCEGDLGEKMEDAFRQAFAEGFEEVGIIGTDCPYLSARWIETAWLSGRGRDLIVGPTYDGGYYFLGMKQFTTAPFRGVPWSADNTLAKTLEQCEQAGLSVLQLPPLGDIDYEEDWLQALESPLGPKLKKALEQAI